MCAMSPRASRARCLPSNPKGKPASNVHKDRPCGVSRRRKLPAMFNPSRRQAIRRPVATLLGASLRPERKISVFFAAKSDCVDGTWQRSYIPKMVVIGVHTAAADSSSSSARNLSRRSRATRYPALVLALEIALVLALNHPGVLALSSSSSSGSSSGASRPRGRLLPCRVHAARRASVTPTRALLGGIRRRSRATYARQERLRGTP